MNKNLVINKIKLNHPRINLKLTNLIKLEKKLNLKKRNKHPLQKINIYNNNSKINIITKIKFKIKMIYPIKINLINNKLKATI